MEMRGLVGIGTAIRHRLGRWEIPAAEAYRNAFINLDDLATTVRSLTTAKRILEIGCGDGSFGQRLCGVFPDAEYLGIDIAPNPGRLFRGDAQRAQFRTMSAGDLVAEGPAPFDLVAFVDVLHHVPEPARVPILADAAALTAPDGMIAIKEWERGRGLTHLACYAADRYVTGDKDVRFATREDLRSMFDAGLPGFALVGEARIPPRRNNVLCALRRPG
jgi:2-polyprenyl-6-hydroxyphenyl methylase/3-demethylubiquinone-9 3-methyltransferase